MSFPIMESRVRLLVHRGAERAHLYASSLSSMHGAVVMSQAVPLDPVAALGTRDLLLGVRETLSHRTSEIGGVAASDFGGGSLE